MPIRQLGTVFKRAGVGLALGLSFSMAAGAVNVHATTHAHEVHHSNNHHPYHTNRRESCEERRRETEYAQLVLKDGSFSGGSCVCEVCVAPS